MIVVNDSTAKAAIVAYTFNTSKGYARFITDTGNKFEAVARFKDQTGESWVDSWHARSVFL